jgi:hypothetical protein
VDNQIDVRLSLRVPSDRDGGLVAVQCEPMTEQLQGVEIIRDAKEDDTLLNIVMCAETYVDLHHGIRNDRISKRSMQPRGIGDLRFRSLPAAKSGRSLLPRY